MHAKVMNVWRHRMNSEFWLRVTQSISGLATGNPANLLVPDHRLPQSELAPTTSPYQIYSISSGLQPRAILADTYMMVAFPCIGDLGIRTGCLLPFSRSFCTSIPSP